MNQTKNKFIVRLALWVCDFAQLFDVLVSIITFGFIRPERIWRFMDWIDSHGIQLWVSAEELINKMGSDQE